jgi:hypothetical protein
MLIGTRAYRLRRMCTSAVSCARNSFAIAAAACSGAIRAKSNVRLDRPDGERGEDSGQRGTGECWRVGGNLSIGSAAEQHTHRLRQERRARGALQCPKGDQDFDARAGAQSPEVNIKASRLGR